MGSSRYIGRVGALAVALGIGSAIAAGPAWAEPSDPESPSTSSTPEGNTSAPETNTGSQPDNTPSPATPSVTDARTTEPVSETELSDKPARTPKRKGSRRQLTEISTNADAQEAVPIAERRPTELTPRRSAPRPAAPESVPSAIETVHAAVDPAPQIAASTGTNGTTAAEVATVGPSATPGGDIPVQTPAEWTLLAAARREIGADAQGTTLPATQTTAQPLATAVTNTPPVITAPTITANAETGVVTGKINATDPEKKKLTYTSAGGPSTGLAFNNKTATFTYTPTTAQRVLAGLSTGPVTVSFSVVVSDGPNSITTTVSVPVGKIPITDAGVIDTGTGPGTSAFSVVASSTRAYVSNADNTITVIDTVNRTVIDTIELDSAAVGTALAPDGKKLYVATLNTQGITVINTATNTITSTIVLDGRWADLLTVSPDGKTLYALTLDVRADIPVATVTKIATGTGKVTGTVALPDALVAYDEDTGEVNDYFYSVVVTPDSKKIYVIADLQSDGEVAPSGLFAFSSTAKTAAIVDEGLYFTEAVISPDGKRLYVNDVDAGEILVYNTSGDEVFARFSNADGALGSIALTGDGSVLIAVNGETNTVIAYETTSGDYAAIKTLSTGVNTDGFWPASTVSPDGKEFFHGADGGALQVISLIPTGTTRAIPASTIGTANPTTGAVTGTVTTAPVGKKLTYALVTGPGQGTFIFDKATGAFTYTPTAAQRVLAGLSSDPTTVAFTATISDGKTTVPVQIAITINPLTISEAGHLSIGENAYGLAVTNNRAYVSNVADGKIVVIDTINRTVLAPIDIGAHVAGLAITPDGKKLYAANIDAGNIAVIDVVTGLVTKTIALAGKTPLAMAISPDGKTVYASTGVLDGLLQPVRDTNGNYIPATITKISTSTDKVTGTVTGVGTQPVSIVVSPDGKKVYAVSLYFDSQAGVIAGSTVHAFSSSAKKATTITGLGSSPMNVAVSPDSTRLYVTGSSSTLYTVETNKYTVLGSAGLGLNAVAITAGKDGSLVLVSGTDGRIGVFDAKTLAPLSHVHLGGEINGIFTPFTLSPDGMQAYTFNGDQLQIISLVPPNDFPAAHIPNVNAPNSSGVVTGNLTATDSNGDKLTFTATKPANGTVVVNSDGGFTYTPTAAARHNAAGTGPDTDTFTITIDDGRRGILTQTVTVGILPANNNPVPKQSATKTNSSTGVVTGSVTATDKDKDTITYAVSTPAGGSVQVTTKGAWTYTPSVVARHAAAGTGPKTDSFTITINDGHGDGVNVPVTVNISPKNAKPTVTYGTPQTNTTTGVVTVQLTTSDPDGDTVIFTNGPSPKGSYTIAGSTLTYTPTQTARDNAAIPGATAATKSDTLLIAYTDSHGGTGTLTVRVDVAPALVTPNAVPTANPTVTVDPQSASVRGFLNAIDPDGDTLTFTVSAVPARGSVEIYGEVGEERFTYWPTDAAKLDAALGPGQRFDSFSFEISDGHNPPVTITVDGLPIKAEEAVFVKSIYFGEHGAGYRYVTVSPDGSLVGVETRNLVMVFDTQTGEKVASQSNAGDAPIVNNSVNGGLRTYTLKTFGVVISDRMTGALVADIDMGIRTEHLALSPDGTRLYVVGSSSVVIYALAQHDIPDPSTDPAAQGSTATPNATETINYTTGVVSGSVTGQGGAGIPPGGIPAGTTYTGTTSGALGSVVVNPDGTYVFTPSAAARQLAAQSTKVLRVLFLLKATDAAGVSVAIPINVPLVAPGRVAPTEAVPRTVQDFATLNGFVDWRVGYSWQTLMDARILESHQMEGQIKGFWDYQRINVKRISSPPLIADPLTGTPVMPDVYVVSVAYLGTAGAEAAGLGMDPNNAFLIGYRKIQLGEDITIKYDYIHAERSGIVYNVMAFMPGTFPEHLFKARIPGVVGGYIFNNEIPDGLAQSWDFAMQQNNMADVVAAQERRNARVAGVIQWTQQNGSTIMSLTLTPTATLPSIAIKGAVIGANGAIKLLDKAATDAAYASAQHPMWVLESTYDERDALDGLRVGLP